MTKYTATKIDRLFRKTGFSQTPHRNTQIRVKRNKECQCGSGKKMKDCCNPVKIENACRYAANKFATEFNSSNVLKVGMNGVDTIFIILKENLFVQYPTTYMCDGTEYSVVVQVNGESQD